MVAIHAQPMHLTSKFYCVNKQLGTPITKGCYIPNGKRGESFAWRLLTPLWHRKHHMGHLPSALTWGRMGSFGLLTHHLRMSAARNHCGSYFVHHFFNQCLASLFSRCSFIFRRLLLPKTNRRRTRSKWTSVTPKDIQRKLMGASFPDHAGRIFRNKTKKRTSRSEPTNMGTSLQKKKKKWFRLDREMRPNCENQLQ